MSVTLAGSGSSCHASDDDITTIASAYHSGIDPDGEGDAQVRLVSLDQIKANGYDLNIGR